MLDLTQSRRDFSFHKGSTAPPLGRFPLASALASKIMPAPGRGHDFHHQHLGFVVTFGFGALDGSLGFLLGALGGSIGLTSGALGGSSVSLGALLASLWMLLRLS